MISTCSLLSAVGVATSLHPRGQRRAPPRSDGSPNMIPKAFAKPAVGLALVTPPASGALA